MEKMMNQNLSFILFTGVPLLLTCCNYYVRRHMASSMNVFVFAGFELAK